MPEPGVFALLVAQEIIAQSPVREKAAIAKQRLPWKQKTPCCHERQVKQLSNIK